MRADEIMTSPVISVHTTTPIREAAAVLSEHNISSLPVLDEDDALVGIVSELDLLRDRMPHDPRSHLRPHTADEPDPKQLVGEVMSPVVVCLSPSADSADLASTMIENNVRAVPIVDGERIVGIVSRRDVIRTLLRDDTGIRADVQQRLVEYSPDAEGWKLDVDGGAVTVRGHFADNQQQRTVEALVRSVPGVIRVHVHQQHWPQR
jgi:CBS domain-containing protein